MVSRRLTTPGRMYEKFGRQSYLASKRCKSRSKFGAARIYRIIPEDREARMIKEEWGNMWRIKKCLVKIHEVVSNSLSLRLHIICNVRAENLICHRVYPPERASFAERW